LQLAIESGNFGKDTIDKIINDSDSSDKINRFEDPKSLAYKFLFCIGLGI
jgi:hypothetical protein